MSAMMRMMLPPMVANISRTTAHSVLSSVLPEAMRNGTMDGQQVCLRLLSGAERQAVEEQIILLSIATALRIIAIVCVRCG